MSSTTGSSQFVRTLSESLSVRKATCKAQTRIRDGETTVKVKVTFYRKVILGEEGKLPKNAVSIRRVHDNARPEILMILLSELLLSFCRLLQNE